MKRKMFAFDLDGTLLNSEGKISEKNVQALESARKNGHILVISTGRNYIYTQMALKQDWGLFDYYVGCNGALIHSINSRKIIERNNKINFDFIMDLILEIREIGGTIQVSTEWNVFTDIYIEEERYFFSQTFKERLIDPFPSVFEMSDEDKERIVQISVHFEEHNVKKMWEKWNKEYGNQYEFTITSKNNIDINLKDISKLSGIIEVMKIEEIPFEDVFVFGDSENDMKALGYFNNTYAMGNAFDNVKKIAKNIIGDNDTDDISKVILKNL